MHSECLGFYFLLSFGWAGGFFSSSICSQHVPFKLPMVPNLILRFPMCSPRVFPIAPRFNPLCFAQCPPFLTYIGGPKREALHLSIESFILGSLHSFNLFFTMGQSNCLIATKKKGWTFEAPPTT
jgi:hypothetical protein